MSEERSSESGCVLLVMFISDLQEILEVGDPRAIAERVKEKINGLLSMVEDCKNSDQPLQWMKYSLKRMAQKSRLEDLQLALCQTANRL